MTNGSVGNSRRLASWSSFQHPKPSRSLPPRATTSGRRAQSSIARAENWRKTPSPRFSTAGDQRLDLGLLDRLRLLLAEGQPAPTPADFLEHVLVLEALQGRLHGGLLPPLVAEVVEVLDVLEVVLPDLVDRPRQRPVLLGQGD